VPPRGPDAAQLVITGPFQKAGRHVELAAAGIGGIDLFIFQNGYGHLIQGRG